MVHAKASSGKRDEPETAPGWTVALVFAPLLVAAAALLSLVVAMHVLYQPWLLDSRYRQYSLYVACFATVSAFLVCCCIACVVRRKQMYGRSSLVTSRTRLLNGKTYLPLYMAVDAPPTKISVLPVTFVSPPGDATKPAAG